MSVETGWLGLPLVDHVHHCRAEDLLLALPDASVSLIACDPPYNVDKVREWDKWESVGAFVAWVGGVLDEMRRVLKPNGSLYWFAAPRYAWHVEGAIRDRFNVLTNVRWQKPPYATKAEMFDKDTMRAYFPASETIIFAEHYGADGSYQDALIDENSTYWEACESVKRGIFGEYLTAEFDRAGVTRKEIAALFPSKTGGLTGCVSNWVLGYNCPTPEQYHAMRDYLNDRNGGDYLRREYEDLRREYEDLRREYEDLRREYEDLRRPFTVSADVPYTDVWTFPTVQAYAGKHPAEKPLALMEHIVTASSRPGDIVLDPFAGSGTTLRAAKLHGRRFIGCDMDAHWVAEARQRLDPQFGGHRVEVVAETLDDLPMFRLLQDAA